MRQAPLLATLVVHIVAAPLNYPIDPGKLIPCQDGNRPWLCRLQVEYSRDTLNYISTLHITDPYFYDAFEESEIYQYFRPVRESQPPSFYLWEEESLRDVFLDSPNYFQDVYLTLMQDLKTSQWRTFNRSEAVLHYVAYPYDPLYPPGWSRSKIEHASEITEAFAERVLSSEVYRRYNGSNFFYAVSSWSPERDALWYSDDVFARIELGKELKNVSAATRLFLGSTGMHHISVPVPRVCTVITHYSAPPESLNLGQWPMGPLESYKYPLGHYAQMLRERPHFSFFAGQIDRRSACAARRALLRRRVRFCERKAVIVQSGKGRDILRECTLNDTCGCVKPRSWSGTSHLREIEMKSRFGFHLRGDDWSSARIAEIIALGMIPIVVGKEMFTWSMAGQCSAPWRKMAIYVDEDAFIRDPAAAVFQAVDSLSHQDYEKMLRLLYYYRPSVVHGSVIASVAQERMKQIAHDCVPESTLQELGYTKLWPLCPFEELTPRVSLPSLFDVEDGGVSLSCAFSQACRLPEF